MEQATEVVPTEDGSRQLWKTYPLEVGTVLQARGSTDTSVHVRIIARIHALGTAGLLVHPNVVTSLETAPGTRLYAQPALGVSDADLAKKLEAGFRRAPLTVVQVKAIRTEEQAVLGALQTLIAVFLGLGIVVGMVGLGLITARNVVVRRQEVGMLRSVGAQRGQVLALFGFETVYLTGMACLIGLGAGLLLATSFLILDDFVTFTVDWTALVMLYGTTIGAAIVTALIPAWAASRMAPAQAVRAAD